MSSLATVIPHYVNGQRTEPATGCRTADVYDPSTGEVQAQVALASKAEVDAAIAAAAEAQPAWAALNPQKRARILVRYVELLDQHKDELAVVLSSEHGKTVEDAKGDLQRGIEVAEFATGVPHLLKGEYTDSAGTGIDVYSMRQPLGVVAGITPFNFPAMIPLWKLAPAIAAGNTFVLKPSERDPSVPMRLAELAAQAGMPPGVLNVVNGDKEAVDAILDSPTVKAVGFVGSTPIAQYIYERAAATGKRAQCFGGAKNHAIVMPDADMDVVVDALMGAAYGSAGERCMAISVAVPVGEDTADRLVAALIPKVRELTVGAPTDPGSDYGPLVTKDALERVTGYLQTGVDEGAELVVDGREGDVAGDPDGFYIAGSLFDRVQPHHRVYLEEIFGPVLSIVRTASLDEAIALTNAHQYGNGAAIFTSSGHSAREFARQIEAGMVGVNVPIPVPIAYHTFGGWKASAFGDLNQHGPDSIRFYTRTKTVTSRWPAAPDPGASFVMPQMG